MNLSREIWARRAPYILCERLGTRLGGFAGYHTSVIVQGEALRRSKLSV